MFYYITQSHSQEDSEWKSIRFDNNLVKILNFNKAKTTL